MAGKRHRLAARRRAVGFSQEALAEAVGVDRSTVVRWERADTDPQPWHRRRLAEALDISLDALAELLDEVGAGQAVQASVPFGVQPGVPTQAANRAGTGARMQEVDPMRRRSFVSGLLGLGVVTPLLAEASRHGLHAAFAAERGHADLDEWRQVIQEYGARYLTTAPIDLANALWTDLAALQAAADAERDERRLCGLAAVAATLAVYTAMTFTNLHDRYGANRWWRTANRLADQSGDLATIGNVRTREIIYGQYDQRPIDEVLKLVEQANPLVAAAPAAVRANYAGGSAQALALAGRRAEAKAALAQMHRAFDQLGPQETREDAMIFGFPSNCVLFAESYVYSYLGDYAAADAAQRAAVRAYPPGYRRGPAQIELQRAVCLVKEGDVASGVTHAGRVLTELPAADRIRPVADLGRRILDAVPVGARSRAGVAEYRELLHSIATPSDGRA